MPTPNTITSPEQQGVMSLLNLARPASDGSGALPLQSGVDKLIEMMTRGMANIRSESAAKTAAQDVASAPTPEIQTKTRVDPTTGRQIHDIHYKNIQFGDAQGEVQQAYDKPQQEANAALAPPPPTPQQQIDAYIQEEAKRRHLDAPGSGGVYPPDLQQAVLDTFKGKYAAERKAGNNPIRALLNAAVMQALPTGMERHQEDEFAKSQDAQRFETALQYAKAELPIAAESDRQRRLNEEQQRNDAIASRFETRDLRTLISKTNLSDQPDDESAIQKIAGDKGVDPASLQAWAVQRIKDKRATDMEAARANQVKLFRKDRAALGQFPTPQAAQASLGVPVAAKEQAGFNADYAAAREETLRVRQNELFKVRSDARAADAAGRSAAAADRAAAHDTGKTVDAGALLRGTLTADALVARRGNEKYDQDSVEAAIGAGTEHFTNAVKDRQTRMDMIDKIVQTPLGGLTPDKALSVRETFIKLRAQKRELLRQNNSDLASLKKLGGAPAVTATQPAQPVIQGTKGAVVNTGGKLVYQPQ
jgi:hypothetical protein